MAPMAYIEYTKNNHPVQIRTSKTVKPKTQARLEKLKQFRDKVLENLRKTRQKQLEKAKAGAQS